MAQCTAVECVYCCCAVLLYQFVQFAGLYDQPQVQQQQQQIQQRQGVTGSPWKFLLEGRRGGGEGGPAFTIHTLYRYSYSCTVIAACSHSTSISPAARPYSWSKTQDCACMYYIHTCT
jgi:hypothetical protein